MLYYFLLNDSLVLQQVEHLSVLAALYVLYKDFAVCLLLLAQSQASSSYETVHFLLCFKHLIQKLNVLKCIFLCYTEEREMSGSCRPAGRALLLLLVSQTVPSDLRVHLHYRSVSELSVQVEPKSVLYLLLQNGRNSYMNFIDPL